MDEQNSNKVFEFVNCGPATIKTEAEDGGNVPPVSGDEGLTSESHLVKSEPINFKNDVTEISSNNNSADQLHGGDHHEVDGSGSDSEEVDDWAPVNCEVQIDEMDVDLTFKTETDIDFQLNNVNFNHMTPSTSQEFVTPRFDGVSAFDGPQNGETHQRWEPMIRLKEVMTLYSGFPPEVKNALGLKKSRAKGPHHCDLCPYVTPSKWNLKLHMNRHLGEKPHACDQCSYRCGDKKSLRMHKMVHSGEKPFKCEQCDYRCTAKSHLNEHVRRHTGEMFRCVKCPYEATSKHNLVVHIRGHSGEKPFGCALCAYRCTTKNGLKLHVATKHTGEKRFSCELCSYKSSQSSNLKVHMMKHTGHMPFACGLCDYKCANKVEFDVHQRKHSGEKPFKCDACGYECARKRSMVVHMQVHAKKKIKKKRVS